MDAQKFLAKLQADKAQFEDYAKNQFPKKAGAQILRFIDNNFRQQGWNGAVFEKWLANKRGGTILVQKGILRRSFRQSYAPGEVRTFTDIPYAAVHNRGFKGTVNVKGHTRNQFTQSEIGTGKYEKNGKEYTKKIHTISGTSEVKGHTRQMNIPKRQFMPESSSDSPTLVADIRKAIINDIKTIFK